MKKLLFLLFAAIFIILMAVSCQSKVKHICTEDELEKTKNYSTTELINYMCDGCRGRKDFKDLSKILGISTTSLEDLRNGDTTRGHEFYIKVRVVTTRYIQHGCSIDELKKSYDDPKPKNKPVFYKYPKWLRTLLIILDILIFIFVIGNDDDKKGCLIAYFVLSIVIWIVFMVFRV